MQFAPEAVAALQRYHWPGNIRELRNVVERVMLLATSNEVDAEAVSLALPQKASGNGGGGASVVGDGPLSERVAEYERQVIMAELKQHAWHITNTAKALGLERSHLYKKCQQLGIDLGAARQQAGESG
jgi:DNA-binding NtrC family response regulator